MAQKINPISFRLGITKDWSSRWFNLREYKNYLEEDMLIRRFLKEKFQKAAIESVIIERSANSIKIVARTARPGMIIGRGGAGVEEVKKELFRKIFKSKKTNQIRLEIEEIRKPETHAALIAQNIAEQLEKRIAFRRVMKQAITRTMSNKDVKGIKVEIAGRLGGAEMSRREWLKEGRLPLQTLRADIDFAQLNAYTTYGVIGIKVWLYKGEIL